MNPSANAEGDVSAELRGQLGLRADCGSCFALCCVALAFEKSADFPERKAAGDPCRNLQSDFRCGTHTTLRANGWNGCTVYDCFGAGQKVSQHSFGGTSWRDAPSTQREMFALLPVMRQLHELLWYLSDGLGRTSPGRVAPSSAARGGTADAAAPAVRAGLPGELRAAIDRVDALTRELPAVLLALDIAALRFELNALLLEVSEASRFACWKTMPIWSRRRAAVSLRERPAAAVPLINTEPCCGEINVEATARTLDLPEPLGPVIAVISPGLTVRLAPSIAVMTPSPFRRQRPR